MKRSTTENLLKIVEHEESKNTSNVSPWFSQPFSSSDSIEKSLDSEHNEKVAELVEYQNQFIA